MARIQEEVIVITVSKLHKNPTKDDMVTDSDIVNEETMAALASVAEELLGSAVVVEVSKA